jgi:methionine-rich copper-binding protein CopC
MVQNSPFRRNIKFFSHFANKLSIKTVVAAIVSSLILVTSIAPASAHTSLVNSNPIKGAIVKVMPNTAWLEFNEKLIIVGNTNPNTLQFFDSTGKKFSSKTPKVRGNRISVSLSPNMAYGIVTVKYRVVAADGHPVSGSFTYTCAR